MKLLERFSYMWLDLLVEETRADAGTPIRKIKEHHRQKVACEYDIYSYKDNLLFYLFIPLFIYILLRKQRLIFLLINCQLCMIYFQ